MRITYEYSCDRARGSVVTIRLPSLAPIEAQKLRGAGGGGPGHSRVRSSAAALESITTTTSARQE